MSHELDRVRVRGLDYLRAGFGEERVERAVELTGSLRVEVPAWQFWEGFGGGGRFDRGGSGGAARTVAEIAADAGLVNRLTGAAPTVGMHVLWSFSADGREGDFALACQAAAELEAQGVRLGAVSPTYFLAGSEDGSLGSRDRSARQAFIAQSVLAARIAVELGSGIVSLWLPDGTNYPGQRGLREQLERVRESLEEFRAATGTDTLEKLDRVLVEYKLFEPGTYSTTIPDWGTALELSRVFGAQGAVLIDLGHHPHGTNLEQIVAALIAFGARGGLHFNTRYAADDDHAVQADYQLALIFNELVEGGVLFDPDPRRNWPLALDQMARRERRIPAVLKSIEALQRALARALLLDPDLSGLALARESGDLIAANAAFERALLHADSGPIVMEALHRQGLHPHPLSAYRDSGRQARIEAERTE